MVIEYRIARQMSTARPSGGLNSSYIVEFEQHGEDRAKYGSELLEILSRDLAAKGLRGLATTNLKQCRQLYRTYPQIGQTLSGFSGDQVSLHPIRQTPSDEFTPVLTIPTSLMSEFRMALPSISTSAMSKLLPPPKDVSVAVSAPVVRKSAGAITPLSANAVLHLSWTQLIELIRLDDPIKRAFYENECLKGNWSVRQLQRQIGSLLYERTGLSKNKEAVVRRAHGQERQATIADLIRDPYVLLDLKIRPFRHGDADQMNFYLNWWKQNVTAAAEQPPVGILLCSDRDHVKVEFATAGMDNRLFVSRYLTALPSAEQLQRFVETDRSRVEAVMEQGTRAGAKPAAAKQKRTKTKRTTPAARPAEV